MPEATSDDDLEVEGVAAQLYMRATPGPFAWWPTLLPALKNVYRGHARARLVEIRQEAHATNSKAAER
jgi:hypothetical protein